VGGIAFFHFFFVFFSSNFLILIFVVRLQIAQKNVIGFFVNSFGSPLSGYSLYNYVFSYGMNEGKEGIKMNFLDTRHMSTTHFFMELESVTVDEQAKRINNRALLANHTPEVMRFHYNDFRMFIFIT
jgi:hypothetical protein